MKKLFYFVMITCISIGLFACDSIANDVILDTALEYLDITYANEDDIDHVREDISFIAGEYSDTVSITWVSSHPDVIEIDGSMGIVTRGDVDVVVTITATVNYETLSKDKVFELTVLKNDDGEIPLSDLEILEQVKDSIEVIYQSGDDATHTTENIAFDYNQMLSDDVDVSISSSHEEVILIDELVGYVIRNSQDVEVVITFDLSLRDASTQKTMTLTVLAKEVDMSDDMPPMIFGIDSHIIYVGDETLDLYEGVTVVDDIDEDITLEIDDTSLDVSEAGLYDVYYRATDSSDQTTEIKSQIIVIEQSSGETFIETFDQLDISGSSYVSGSFTGVNGVNWSYSGARGDQQLDGQAIAFGGKISDDSYLQATIDGGITSLSLSYDKPFSNGQIYDVMINDNIVGSFDNSNGSGEYSIDDLNISGTFTIKIAPQDAEDGRRQMTLDNLSWTSFGGQGISDDFSDLLDDYEALDLIDATFENTILDLPELGDNNSSISWSVIQGDPYIDLNSQLLQVPNTGQTQVVLEALLQLGDVEVYKTFVITIGLGDPYEISEIKLLDEGSFVHTQGVISYIDESSDTYIAYLQDQSAAIKLALTQAQSALLTIGHEFEITGMISNDMIDVSTLKDLGEDYLYTPEVLASDLSDYVSMKVDVSGYVDQAYENQSQTFVLKTMDGNINLSILDDETDISSMLNDAKLGYYVELSGIVYEDQNLYYIYLIDDEDIMVDDHIDQDMIDDLILNELTFIDMPSQTTSDLVLIDSDDLSFDATITWQSADPQVIDTEGIVYSVDEDITVTLSYEIRNHLGDVIDQMIYQITVVSSSSNYTGNYYNSINFSLSGSALKYELQALISQMNDRGYDFAKTALQDSDEDPSNPSKMILVYNRDSINSTWDSAATWNREHIWPQSKLGSASKSDLFNLRPANTSINSNRGNYPFGDYRSTSSQGYGLYSGYWYPGDDDRGDIARAVLYMNTRWGLTISSGGIGSLETFITWHEEDPVDAFEMHRNDVIYSYQGNRNPYVDFPYLVDEIYA